ncbi:MAG: nucleotidyl transferase AbiEii/AbiGii toxin family protein, partial [Deltaproteobacteria bacterium]|nr:nucleotidyl transferase AbiEii/AbiGii toxin family protein [Deltaproteobacteria bacterium]
MKEEALALVAAIDDPARRLNLLREYLQAFALRSLHESEAFMKIAFVGGTALRFLHGLPRFSEDLDFSLTDSQGYEPERWLRKL